MREWFVIFLWVVIMKRVQILDQKIRSLAQTERDALAQLLTQLRNLDAIRGFEELGYASLFVYLTKGVGYSAGQAQRRIDAARQLRSDPRLPKALPR